MHPTFFTAGKAVFTVSNPAGVRYTYRIRAPRDNTRPRLFAQLLTGPDNTRSYTYLGMVVPGASEPVRLTQASKLPAASTPVRVLRWVLRLAFAGKPLPAGYAVRHAGKCGKCGRTLTVPRSIDLGLGPECEKALGLLPGPAAAGRPALALLA